MSSSWEVGKRYIIALDFEATCEEGTPYENPGQEIIEFPAVAIDTLTNRTVAEFHSYVNPTLKPKLSAYCSNLTGITQETIDSSPGFKEVLGMFLIWLDEVVSGKFNDGLGQAVQSPGEPNFSSSKKVTFAIHGTLDLLNFIKMSCRVDNIPLPDIFKGDFIDITKTAKTIFNKDPTILRNCHVTTKYGNPIRPQHEVSLKNLAAIFKVQFGGKNHCGIEDARVVSKLLINWAQAGYKIKANRSMGV